MDGMTREDTWRLGHRPAIDGLRGLAVLLVVTDHAGFTTPGSGSIGVTVFFVLSGFLITRLILEARTTGTWSLRRFYWNRAVRLVPALVFMVLSVSAVLVFVRGWTTGDATSHALPALLYVQNYMPAGRPSYFAHAWSLGVEEQFYLLWPLLLPLLLRSPRRAWWIGAAVVTSVGLSLSAVDNGALPMHSYGLLAGGALAMVVHRLPRAPKLMVLAVVGLAGCLVLSSQMHEDSVIPRMLAVPCALLLLWRLLDGEPVFGSLPLRFLGRISYAIYLWHLPLLSLAYMNHGGVPSLPVVLLAVLVASGSTLLLEEPLRRRFRRRQDKRVSAKVACTLSETPESWLTTSST